MASWFSSQWHVVDSSIQSIAELNSLLRDVENLPRTYDEKNDVAHAQRSEMIDVAAISHEFTDHCNKRTLLELDPLTPIFAPKVAADLIRSWKHFARVLETPAFSRQKSDWRKTSLDPLPGWIGIARSAPESDSLYYHSAILITFNLQGVGSMDDTAEAVIYTPHGIRAEDVQHLPGSNPPVQTLVLIHGMHDIKLTSKQLNLGAHNGLRVQRICHSKYWVSTHDEVKKARGLIAPFLYRKALTLQEALKQERAKTGHILDRSQLVDAREVVFRDLKNGESMLLA